jgi:hypothetical protein
VVLDHKDVFGGTLLHYAAEGNCLRDVPLPFLTPYNLFCLKKKLGTTPIDIAAPRNLDQIPWEAFRAYEWLKYAAELEELSSPPFPQCEALSQFVSEVVTLKRLKQQEPFDEE